MSKLDKAEVVYMACYDDSDVYGDGSYTGDDVYLNKEDCEKEILDQGYTKSEEDGLYYLDEWKRDLAYVSEIKVVVNTKQEMMSMSANRFKGANIGQDYNVKYENGGVNYVMFNTLVQVDGEYATFNGGEGFATIPLKWITSMTQRGSKDQI